MGIEIVVICEQCYEVINLGYLDPLRIGLDVSSYVILQEAESVWCLSWTEFMTKFLQSPAYFPDPAAAVPSALREWVVRHGPHSLDRKHVVERLPPSVLESVRVGDEVKEYCLAVRSEESSSENLGKGSDGDKVNVSRQVGSSDEGGAGSSDTASGSAGGSSSGQTGHTVDHSIVLDFPSSSCADGTVRALATASIPIGDANLYKVVMVPSTHEYKPYLYTPFEDYTSMTPYYWWKYKFTSFCPLDFPSFPPFAAVLPRNLEDFCEDWADAVVWIHATGFIPSSFVNRSDSMGDDSLVPAPHRQFKRNAISREILARYMELQRLVRCSQYSHLRKRWLNRPYLRSIVESGKYARPLDEYNVSMSHDERAIVMAVRNFRQSSERTDIVYSQGSQPLHFFPELTEASKVDGARVMEEALLATYDWDELKSMEAQFRKDEDMFDDLVDSYSYLVPLGMADIILSTLTELNLDEVSSILFTLHSASTATMFLLRGAVKFRQLKTIYISFCQNDERKESDARRLTGITVWPPALRRGVACLAETLEELILNHCIYLDDSAFDENAIVEGCRETHQAYAAKVTEVTTDLLAPEVKEKPEIDLSSRTVKCARWFSPVEKPMEEQCKGAIPTAMYEGVTMKVLTRLVVVNAPKITARSLSVFLSRCPNLISLDLSDSPHLFTLFYNHCERAPDIQDLSQAPSSTSAVPCLSSREGDHDGKKKEGNDCGWRRALRELRLGQAEVFQAGTVEKIDLRTVPSVIRLHVACWHDATDATASKLVCTAKGLQEMRLTLSPHITSKFVKTLRECHEETLQQLDISCNQGIDSFDEVLRMKRLEKLVARGIGQKALKSLEIPEEESQMRLASALRSLDLSHTRNCDAEIVALAKYLNRNEVIETLTVVNCLSTECLREILDHVSYKVFHSP